MPLQKFIRLAEYNPYHDARGRFTGSGGAAMAVQKGHGAPGGSRSGKAWAQALERRYGGAERVPRPRRAGGQAEGGDRTPVPQNPGKHVRPMSRADSFGEVPWKGMDPGRGFRSAKQWRRAQIESQGSPLLAQALVARRGRPDLQAHNEARDMYGIARRAKTDWDRKEARRMGDKSAAAAGSRHLDRERVHQDPRRHSFDVVNDGQPRGGRDITGFPSYNSRLINQENLANDWARKGGMTTAARLRRLARGTIANNSAMPRETRDGPEMRRIRRQAVADARDIRQYGNPRERVPQTHLEPYRFVPEGRNPGPKGITKAKKARQAAIEQYGSLLLFQDRGRALGGRKGRP